MKSSCLSAFLLIVAAPLVGSAQSVSPAADSVRSLDSLWARSCAVHDTASALRLFDSTIVIASGQGTLKSRDQELGDIRSQPGLAMEYFRTSEVIVRMHRDAAVVTGIAQWAFTFNGRQQDARRRYTATYARGGPLGWRMIALHIGPAPAVTTPGG